MPIPALALAGISLGSKLLGAFGKKKKEQAAEKLQKEQEANLRAAQKAQFGQNEAGRIAALKSILAQAGARGIKGMDPALLDPSVFQAREFIAPAEAKNTGKSTFGDILGGIGGIGSAFADFKSQQAGMEEGNPPTSAGQPVGGGAPLSTFEMFLEGLKKRGAGSGMRPVGGGSQSSGFDPNVDQY